MMGWLSGNKSRREYSSLAVKKTPGTQFPTAGKQDRARANVKSRIRAAVTTAVLHHTCECLS